MYSGEHTLEHGKFELSVFIVYLSGFLSRLVEIICVCIYMYAGESVVCSVVSDSATPWTIALHGVLQAILQGILLTQGSNPGFLYCRQILYHLSHQGSQDIYIYVCIWSPRKKSYICTYINKCPETFGSCLLTVDIYKQGTMEVP